MKGAWSHVHVTHMRHIATLEGRGLDWECVRTLLEKQLTDFCSVSWVRILRRMASSFGTAFPSRSVNHLSITSAPRASIKPRVMAYKVRHRGSIPLAFPTVLKRPKRCLLYRYSLWVTLGITEDTFGHFGHHRRHCRQTTKRPNNHEGDLRIRTYARKRKS